MATKTKATKAAESTKDKANDADTKKDGGKKEPMNYDQYWSKR